MKPLCRVWPVDRKRPSGTTDTHFGFGIITPAILYIHAFFLSFQMSQQQPPTPTRSTLTRQRSKEQKRDEQQQQQTVVVNTAAAATATAPAQPVNKRPKRDHLSHTQAAAAAAAVREEKRIELENRL